MKNNVLIIDSDKETCKEIKYSLASSTTDAYYCLTIQDGLSALARKDYELVILNISFPETDGMELLHTMRRLKPMPILLLSTSAALDDKVVSDSKDGVILYTQKLCYATSKDKT